MTAYFSVVNFVQCDKTIFILALWFHMLAKDFGVGVNVFWRELEDLHGNKCHLPAAKALRMLDNEMKQLKDSFWVGEGDVLLERCEKTSPQ